MGGNTQAMAEAVADGIRKAGKEAEVAFVGTVPADTLKDASAFALGCPAMGAEVLEESAMEPFVMEVEGFAAGKKIALFGSYGWGDGEWMRRWVRFLFRWKTWKVLSGTAAEIISAAVTGRYIRTGRVNRSFSGSLNMQGKT